MNANVSTVKPASEATCQEAWVEILHPIYRAACLWSHVSDCVLPGLAVGNPQLHKILGRNARRRQAEMGFNSLLWLSHRRGNQDASPADLIDTYLQSNSGVLAIEHAGGKHAGGQRMGMVPCPWCNHNNGPTIGELAPLAGAIPIDAPDVKCWGDWMSSGLQAIWKLQETLPVNLLVDKELRAAGGRCLREVHSTSRELFCQADRKDHAMEILGTPQFVNSMLGRAFLLKKNGLTAAWENFAHQRPASSLADFGQFLKGSDSVSVSDIVNPFRQPTRNCVAVLKAEIPIVAGMKQHPDINMLDQLADHREIARPEQYETDCGPSARRQAASEQLVSLFRQGPYALAIIQGLSEQEARIFEFFANHILKNWSVDKQLSNPELHEELSKQAMTETCRKFGIEHTIVYSIRRRCRPS